MGCRGRGQRGEPAHLATSGTPPTWEPTPCRTERASGFQIHVSIFPPCAMRCEVILPLSPGPHGTPGWVFTLTHAETESPGETATSPKLYTFLGAGADSQHWTASISRRSPDGQQCQTQILRPHLPRPVAFPVISSRNTPPDGQLRHSERSSSRQHAWLSLPPATRKAHRQSSPFAGRCGAGPGTARCSRLTAVGRKAGVLPRARGPGPPPDFPAPRGAGSAGSGSCGGGDRLGPFKEERGARPR